jgi:diadenosine tetraphosphate (Ap4A) HIT family hydrolase
MDTAAMDCLFCRIIARAAEASIVHEGDRAIAFCDLLPVNPGHLLVAPKVHATGLRDLHEDDGRQLFAVGQRLAGVPRHVGDGVRLSFGQSRTPQSRDELDAVAGRIRASL